MKILLVGSGGREHAMARALAGHEVIWAPGNGAEGPWQRRSVPLDEICELALAEKPDLTVIGPEDPLAAGLVDRLRESGLAAWGPTAAQARLESSKAWAKQFMSRWLLPTAAFEVAESLEQAEAAIERLGGAVVVKADGLCAGKGVVVASDAAEARSAAQRLLQDRLVIEKRLQGPEASLILLLRPDGYQAFPLVRDHKRLLAGDRGPNTGGMGAYFPIAEKPVLRPLLDKLWRGLSNEGLNYFGALFVGLMLTPHGPQILEFNCRLGDPETEVLLESLETDFLAALRGEPLRMRPGACLDVVLASPGYPESSTKGLPITGLPEDVTVLQAGTELSQGQLVTAGGRVLHLVARADDLESARRKVYQAAESVRFGDQAPILREDIGASLAGCS